MKVKKQKTDELIDALKQLKLTDRRSRVSLHGRPFSNIFVGVSNDGSLRSRLTRSLSAVAPSLTHYLHHHSSNRMSCSFTNTCPSNYEVGSLMDERLTESMVNDPTQYYTGSTYLNTISSDRCPLTMSAGLLYSTLPFKQVKPATTFTNISCNGGGFRRSFGAGLDQACNDNDGQFTAFPVPCRKSCTNMTTISQGEAIKSDGVSIHDASLQCGYCHNHCNTSTSRSAFSVNRSTLPQSRLFRRLYSLIDHPCINLCRAYRYSSCSHMAMSTDKVTSTAAGKTQPHFAHYRHSLEGSASSANNYHNRLDVCGVASVDSDIPPYCRSPSAVEFSNQLCTLSHACGHFILFGRRTRRNSDPERWQPQLKQELSVTGLKPETFDGSNGAEQLEQCDKKTVCSGGLNQGHQFTQTVNPQTTAAHFFDHLQRSSCASNTYGGSYSSVAISGQQSQRDSHNSHTSQLLRGIPASSSTPHPYTLDAPTAISTHLRSMSNSGDTDRLDVPAGYSLESESSAFRFRASILSDLFDANTKVSDPGGSGDCLCTAPDVDERRNLEPTGDTSSLWGYDNCRTKSSDPHIDLNAIPVTTYTGDIQSCQQVDETSLGATGFTHQLLVATDDAAQEAGQSTTTISMMMTSDVSVSELAAYMEHMVHIPGRMSEMAQRMYI